MEKPNDIQPLVIAGPCRGLIKAVADETGKKYVTVRWHIIESKRRNPFRDRFLELAAEIADDDAEQRDRIERIKIKFAQESQAKAS